MKEIRLRVPNVNAVMRAIIKAVGLFLIGSGCYLNHYAQTWKDFDLLNTTMTYFVLTLWTIILNKWWEDDKED